MQKLLLSTQQKQKHHQVNGTTSKKKGENVLLESSKSNHQAQQKIRISKTMPGMSIKRGYRRAFIVKQPYLDQSLCQLIYLNAKHKNKEGEVCHGKNVVGYQHTLSFELSNGMKAHLMWLLRQGLSLVQVMTHHKAHVIKMALEIEHVKTPLFSYLMSKTWQNDKLMNYCKNTTRILSMLECGF